MVIRLFSKAFGTEKTPNQRSVRTIAKHKHEVTRIFSPTLNMSFSFGVLSKITAKMKPADHYESV